MKTLVTLTVLAMLITIVGCDAPPTDTQTRAEMNRQIARSYCDEAIKNAIIAQHTLYPFHFVNNSTELNEIGKHDLGILADHFKRYPGKLNISHGDENEELYCGRIATATDILKEAGVDMTRVSIADGLPGGDGASSERVISILKKDTK